MLLIDPNFGALHLFLAYWWNRQRYVPLCVLRSKVRLAFAGVSAQLSRSFFERQGLTSKSLGQICAGGQP